MIDRTNIAPPLFEFVVLADTHYVLPEQADSGVFETRRFSVRPTWAADPPCPAADDDAPDEPLATQGVEPCDSP